MSNYPPGLSNGGYRQEVVEHNCKNDHKWEVPMFFELGGWFYEDEDTGPYCPTCGWEDTENGGNDYRDDLAYQYLVSICLESNEDTFYRNPNTGEKEPYDEASAQAAVDTMLYDESGNYNTVLARLMGEV